MKRIVSLYTILVTTALPLGAAQVAPLPTTTVAPAKKVWEIQEEVKKKAVVAQATKTLFSKDDPFIRMFPEDLLRVISDYVPELHPFECTREFMIRGLGPKKQSLIEGIECGICASFIGEDKVRIYVIESKTPGHFMLYDQYGRERARCTAHRAPLTKIMVMPELKKDEKIEKEGKEKAAEAEGAVTPKASSPERAYKFVTSSNDGSIRFWNESGKEVGNVLYKNIVSDFDIATDVLVAGQKRDILAVALGTMDIPICDISSMMTGIIHYSIKGWGNLGVSHVRLLPSAQGLKLVTNESEMDTSTKTQELCWYDVATSQRQKRTVGFEDKLTRMDCVRYDDTHMIILVGDAKGIIRGYLFPDSGDISLRIHGHFTQQMENTNPIINLKAYTDVADDGCPHVVVQTLGSKVLSDVNIRTRNVDPMKPAIKDWFYAGLGSSAEGRTTLLTCSTCSPDGLLQDWEKETDVFNKHLLIGPKQPKQVPVTALPVEAAPIEQPASCSCIIM
jgi:hypothetical protein